MKTKLAVKILIDIMMTVSLLLLMSYKMKCNSFHEWTGIGMFILFCIHHLLNIHWHKALFRGKYTAYRRVQTALVLFILITMIGSMISGIVISRSIFTFMDFNIRIGFARKLHMICGYWGFVLMSLHLGFHWSMIISMASKLFTKPSDIRKFVLRLMTLTIAGYGLYAFFKRNIFKHMIFRGRLRLFNYKEPIVLFVIDYIAVMGLFIFIGYIISKWLKRK